MPNISPAKGSKTILSLGKGPVFKKFRNVVKMLTKGSDESGIINEIARKMKALIRQRQFNFADFICSTIQFHGDGAHHQTTYHLEDVREYYIANFNAKISNKPCHNQVVKKEMLDVVVEVFEHVSQAVRLLAWKYIRTLVPKSIRVIQKQLGIKEMFAVDGATVTLQPGCRGKMPCKGSGRPHKDGTEPAPGLKLHLLASLTRQCLVRADITEAVGDEREHVFLDELVGNLAMFDRGYVSAELENEMIKRGIFFLIKGKSSMANDKVLEAYGDDGQALEGVEGLSYKELKEKYPTGCLDAIVQNAKGNKVRICRKPNPNLKSTRDEESDTADAAESKDPFIYLRTNIMRNKATLEQLFELYRFRWFAEHVVEVLRQGNALQAINSTKETIILQFIVSSLTAAMLKSYLALEALTRTGQDLFTISFLKLNYNLAAFKKFFDSIGRVAKTRMYEIIAETCDRILEFCQRSKPSQRDVAAGKSYVLLAQRIADGSPVTVENP